jgi:hypothetical protein
MHYDTFSNLMKEFSEEEMQQRAAEEKARRWERIHKRLVHSLLGLAGLGIVTSGVIFREEIKVQMDQLTGANQPRETTASEERAGAIVKEANAESAKRAESIENMFK